MFQNLQTLLRPFLSLKRVINSRCQLRWQSTNSLKNNTSTNLILEPLHSRDLIRVCGVDVVPFLQGLITNDMAQLQTNKSSSPSSMYTLLLNSAGRVLYDVLIYSTSEPDTFMIECDNAVTNELRRHLRTFRVRRRIEVESVDKDYKSWVLFSPNESVDVTQVSPSHDIYNTPDPRLRELGLRILTTCDKQWNDVANVFTKTNLTLLKPATLENNYRFHRYKHGVGEGVIDMPPSKCFPLEVNGDFLRGISFNKGCYLGQELTARVFHLGVVRKRLMPIRLTDNLPGNGSTVQSEAGANVGIVRGVAQNRALALLRVDQAINNSTLMIDGDLCYTEKPRWWPASHNKN